MAAALPTSLSGLTSEPRFGKRFNFSAGPGALPEAILNDVQAAIAETPGVGLSLLGISHRTPWFRAVVDEAEDHLRALLSLPSNYRVLFLQGGSSLQFSMIPLSLLRGRTTPADYLVTGYWSKMSIADARREGAVCIAWDGEPDGYRRLPRDGEPKCHADAAYFHYVSNETVEGTQFHHVPGLDAVPRICDMSSDFLCRPIDVHRFSLMYAHAQKNLGPAGVTVVVIRDDVLERCRDDVPTMLDYRRHVEARSIYNTPPVFAIYTTMLVLRWLRQTIGGLAAMGDVNRDKAERLYAVLDAHPDFYRGPIDRADRSWMNVVFHMPTQGLEADFVREAADCGLHGLEGHRSVGGLRASLYNGVTVEAVEALRTFMQDFYRRRRGRPA